MEQAVGCLVACYIVPVLVVGQYLGEDYGKRDLALCKPVGTVNVHLQGACQRSQLSCMMFAADWLF
jgi:hypothetical protein